MPNVRPGEVGEPVGLAIAAAEQIDDRVLRQLLDRRLRRADRARTSGSPVSPIWKSAKIFSRPAGATMRVQMLPKPSS